MRNVEMAKRIEEASFEEPLRFAFAGDSGAWVHRHRVKLVCCAQRFVMCGGGGTGLCSASSKLSQTRELGGTDSATENRRDGGHEVAFRENVRWVTPLGVETASMA
jgi:hypothetical protein